MSRKDSERYRHMRLKVQRRRRFSAAEEKPYVRDRDEQGLSLSPAADASGIPESLLLLPHTAPGLMDLHWLAKELQRRLRSKTLENEILKEALEAARQGRDQCAHRHRR